ncbi:MAG: hypothetical protein ACK4NM_02475 [Hydrogenophaga sp.]
MDPTVIECATSCTVTLVHVISIPPFNLTLEQAGQISGAILLVWAVAAVYREVIHMISDRKSSTSETE